MSESQRINAVKDYLEKGIQLGHFEYGSYEGQTDEGGKLYAYIEKKQYRFRLSHLFSSDDKLRGNSWVVRTVSQQIQKVQMPRAEFLRRVCNHESPNKKEVHLILHDNWHTKGCTNVGQVVYDLLFHSHQTTVIPVGLPSAVSPEDVPAAKAAMVYLGGTDPKTRLTNAINILQAVEEKRELPRNPAIQSAQCAHCNGNLAFCGFKVNV
jgi:hypothetical protein